jgi:hypothetical protein
MATPFDEQIAHVERELEAQRGFAEQALNIFFATLAAEVQAWLPGAMKTQATEAQAQVTKTLAATGQLPAFKAELAALAGTFPALVKGWLGDDRLWPHRAGYVRAQGETGDAGYFVDAKKPRAPDGLNEPFNRGLLSVLGPVLKKHGYQATRPMVHKDVAVLWFPWTASACEALDAYNKILEPFLVLKRKLADLQAARERHEAASEWDRG